MYLRKHRECHETLVQLRPQGGGAKEIVACALIGAVIFTIVSVLLLLFSFGLAALLFVFFGWAVLEITSNVAPEFLTLHPSFWVTALSGFLILIAGIPKRESEPADQ